MSGLHVPNGGISLGCTGCMAALQAEHFLQLHGSSLEDKGNGEAGVPHENGRAMENGAVETARQLAAAL